MRRRSTGMLLILTVCGLACSGDDPVAWVVPEDPSALVLQNVATVKAAANAFADANDGLTAADVDTDTTPEGLTLIDLLPGGQRLLNPYTGERSEPRSRPAERAGEVGYVSVSPILAYTCPPCDWASEMRSAYEISAYDHAQELVRVDNIADLEARTIENAKLVAEAAERWMRDEAHYMAYPAALANFMTQMPDQSLLRNPFTLRQSEPTDGTAGSPGQVGYVPVADVSGVNIGFYVSAFGLDLPIYLTAEPYSDFQSRSFRASCIWISELAQSFASHNDGEFARDVATDTSPDGWQLTSYVGQYELKNPWTGLPLELVDGTDPSPGQVGYQSYESGGLVLRFVITGLGESGQRIELSSY